ncbi:MAG: putative lipid II flippase FtsW [Waddliaceae bacterium]
MKTLYLLFVGVIFVIGLVIIFSTSSAEILDHKLNRSSYEALFKQLAFAVAGGVLGLWIWSLGYRKLLRWSTPLLCFFSLFLLLALIPGIGREVNGSRRWIAVGGFSFQPSEFVKYLLPLSCIQQIVNNRAHSIKFRKFVFLLIPLSLPLVLILLEPNNGTVIVIAATMAALFFVARIPFNYWASPLLALGVAVGVFASHLPYVSGRLKVYLHPELDIRGKGYQPHQAKIAAGSGRLFGKGPGKSWQKLSFLPEAQNDYIAAIYAEEFGFIGILLLIVLYMLLTFIGFYLANHAEDLEGFYTAVIVTFLLSFQVFLNLGVVSGLLPTTGLNLPFFSQGGSSLIANLSGVGLLISIQRVSSNEEQPLTFGDC